MVGGFAIKMVGRFRRINRRLRRFLSQGSIEQRIAPETLREERLRTYSTSKILESSDLDCVLKADLMNNGKHRRLAWQETGNTEDRCNALTREWLEEWQVQIRVKKIAQSKRMAPPGGTPLYRLYRYVRRQRVWFFSRFGYQFWPFWPEIGFGLCTPVLNWVRFFRRSYFFIIRR